MPLSSKYRDVPKQELALERMDRRGRLTRIALPVKVILGITVTAKIQSLLRSRWAVGEGVMPIGDIVEEVQFRLLQQESSGNRVDWSITPTFVEESSSFVEILKIVHVGLASEKVEIAHFKVGPLSHSVSPASGRKS